MNLEKTNKDKKSESVGIFSKIKTFLSRKNLKDSEEEKYREEKEVLKKYEEAIQEEKDKKNNKTIKKSKVDNKAVDYEEAIQDEKDKKNNQTIKEGKVDDRIVNKEINQTINRSNDISKQAWNAPGILKTNLAKGEQVVYIDWTANIKKLLIMSALSCFFLIVIYAGLIAWGVNIRSAGKVLDGDIGLIKSQIASSTYEVEEIDAFYKKLKNADILLDKHIYWSNVFEFVEKNTLSNVRIVDGLSGSPKSEYTFSVLTDNFITLNQQVTHLKAQKEVIDAEIIGGDYVVDAITNSELSKVYLSSSINIKLKPELFYR